MNQDFSKYDNTATDLLWSGATDTPGRKLANLLGDKQVWGQHGRERVVGRLIEEIVELALTMGSNPAKIFGHMMDAMHNEAGKAKMFPSELAEYEGTLQDKQTEIADVSIWLDYLRVMSALGESEIKQAMERKIQELQQASDNGTAVIVDGLIYKKKALL